MTPIPPPTASESSRRVPVWLWIVLTIVIFFPTGIVVGAALEAGGENPDHEDGFSASVRESDEARDAEQAALEASGEWCGRVTESGFYPDVNGAPTFIDLVGTGSSAAKAELMTLVIWGENRDAFPEPPENVQFLTDLCVSGEIYLYEGRKQIEVRDPEEMTILY